MDDVKGFFRIVGQSLQSSYDYLDRFFVLPTSISAD
jgi:hypothetical protein